MTHGVMNSVSQTACNELHPASYTLQAKDACEKISPSRRCFPHSENIIVAVVFPLEPHNGYIGTVIVITISLLHRIGYC